MTNNVQLLLEACKTMLFLADDYIATDMRSSVIRGQIDWCKSVVEKIELQDAISAISNTPDSI